MTHLLIVEDHEENRELLRMLLEANGYRVTAAGDGLEALDAARRDPPDAIISDVLMPKLDGFALCRAWMQDARLRGIPFIFYSATNVRPEDEEFGRTLGAVRYLIKPLEVEVFLGELRAVLRQWTGRAASALAAPVDDVVFHTLHELALARKIEDKIAQLEAANRKLQESEARFRSLTEMSSDFYWESDAEHRLTQHSWVDKASTVSVFRQTARIGEHPWEIPYLSPDEAGWQAHRAVLDAHRPFRDFELSRLGADGTERQISISGDPVFDAASAFKGYRGVGKDITERVKRVDDLRRLRAAMDATADAIYLVDRTSMRFIYVNDAACRMQSCTREELLALGPDGVLSTPRAELEHVYDSIIAGGAGTEPIEMQRQRKDGSQVWVELRRRAQRSGEGWMIVTVVRDVTERKKSEEELKLFRALVDQSNDAIEVVDPDTLRFLDVNQKGCLDLGYTREELLSLSVFDIDPTVDRSTGMEIAQGLRKSRSSIIESRHRRKDGSEFPVEVSMRYIQLDRDYVLSITRDITERKEAENRIRRLNRVYAVLSGINTLIVRVRDRDELFREACRIAIEAGHFAKVWLGMIDHGSKQVRIVAAHGGDPLFFQNLESELSKKLLTGHGLVARALATRRPVVSNDMASDPDVLRKDYAVPGGARSLAVLPLLVSGESVGVFTLNADAPGFFDDEEMKLLVELAANISFAMDHIEKEKKLDYLAYYDVLTGLANRTLFLERVAQYMRGAASGGHKLAVFLIDLERFKNINDSLGRSAGDALLRQVAEWLTRNAGDANLLARLGADHFAAVLPEVKQEGDVARLLEKTMAAFLEHPFRLDDAVFRIATKVGIALFPDDGADADTLFRNAEAALKKAKAGGDRYLFYSQKMTEAVAGKLTLENQLRQALDKGEFVLHYQPKVNLASGKMTSVEALIRWNDPRTGLVPPGRFIPVLEETGLIQEVGRWALHQTIDDYLRWRAAGLAAVRIAVNVSPLQLRHRDFIAEIGQAIGIDAHAATGLELEITESLIMADIKHSIASLRAIRALGVTIAIDDFGTGFSSLSYLAKLPVDTLKIDRSFVIDMTVEPEGLSLVSTIINLAHSLNLKVVAEGVETEEQSRLLRLLKCDEMQGFLFSKPVPVEIFETRFLTPPSAG